MSNTGPRPDDTETAKYLATFVSPYLSAIGNYPRASICDYIVSQVSGSSYIGTPTNPSTNLPTVTGADAAAVITSCAVNLAATSNREGTIGILPALATGSHTCSSTINLHSCTLVALGGSINGNVVLNFSASSALTNAITNGTDIIGIEINLKSGMTGIVSNSQGVILDVLVQGGSTGNGYDLTAGANGVIMLGCSSSGNAVGVVAGGTGCVIIGLVSGNDTNAISLPSGAQNNVIVGTVLASSGVITDASGHVNYIYGSGQNGHLSDPSIVNTAVTNTFGTMVQVIVSIGTTATTVTKNATAVYTSTAPAKDVVTVDLLPGETITLSQTTGVTWTWFAI